MKYGPIFGLSDNCRTPEELIENIKTYEAQGAHGIVLNLFALNREFWNLDSFKQIIRAGCRLEKYACFYRSENTAELSDDERAQYLLLAAQAGADIVDVMGDLFDRSPDGLTRNPQAVARQKALIAQLKQYGGQVLMSSHVLKSKNQAETFQYFQAQYERGADIVKAVFRCDTPEELAESRRTSEALCANFPRPFVYICAGTYGRNVQRFETLLNGSVMTFVRLQDNPEQPTIQQAQEFLRRHTPWARAAGRSACGEFVGRTCVITGGASGMGLVAAQQFAAQGANVLLVDINPPAIDQAIHQIQANGGNAIGMTGDVRQYADAEKAAQLALTKFGRIDYLLCFAGGFEPRCCNSYVPFYEQPLEVINWGLDVNLKGPVYFARACMPAMIKQNFGVIVCLGSVSGVEGSGMGPMYGTSKSGLFYFVKGLALAGAPHHVRAVCVAPGPVMTRPAMANMKTPLGRAAEPIEVVDLIMRLCSSRSDFITGSTHFIDGGYLS